MRLFLCLMLSVLLCSAEEPQEYVWQRATITHYSAWDDEQGTDGTTASGEPVKVGYAASYPGAWPMGTEIYVDGHGPVTMMDTGWGFDDGRMWIDIYVESKEEALRRGTYRTWIAVVE